MNELLIQTTYPQTAEEKELAEKLQRRAADTFGAADVPGSHGIGIVTARTYICKHNEDLIDFVGYLIDTSVCFTFGHGKTIRNKTIFINISRSFDTEFK